MIWLKASVATIVERIQDDDQRPSLTGTQSFTDEVAEVLQRRSPRYRRLSHFEVDTDALTIEQVAAAICARLPA